MATSGLLMLHGGNLRQAPYHGHPGRARTRAGRLCDVRTRLQCGHGLRRARRTGKLNNPFFSPGAVKRLKTKEASGKRTHAKAKTNPERSHPISGAQMPGLSPRSQERRAARCRVTCLAATASLEWSRAENLPPIEFLTFRGKNENQRIAHRTAHGFVNCPSKRRFAREASRLRISPAQESSSGR